MNKFRIFAVIFIAVNLLFSIGDYLFVKNESYEKYLSGEYYFIYEANTVTPGMTDYVMTPDDPMFYADYSDPRNILMTNHMSVRVYNPHDGFCTVIYGDNFIEDFPLSHISLSAEDAPYFNGTKKYTEDEYFNKIEEIGKHMKDKDLSLSINDKHMLDYRHAGTNLIWLLVYTGFLAAIYVIVYTTVGYHEYLDLILLGASGISIIFTLISYMAR